MITTRQFSIGFIMLVLIVTAAACSNGDEPAVVPAPTSEDAAFTYSFDAENPNKVLFTAQPDVPTWYTHWDLGENSSAEGLEASKIYLQKGEYEVRFKIFTEGGTASSVQTITIASDFQGPDILQNGSFDDDQFWTVLPISNGVDVVFEDGKATWTGGGWGHVGIYQEVQVEANKLYQINMDIEGSGMTDCWFEVYAGTAMPTPGVDYTDGGMRLALNTWEGCGGEAFEGQLTDLSCAGGDGTFEFDAAGPVYIVIRGGGADYGATGVTIDNVSVRALE
ncbi:MAG: PKD domain-containing protein [Lewinellaceae bacterium]|nr:PKD domain-containing protein [Lewinellaceae bacterium]